MFTNKPFIVAEISANHLGDLGRALSIIDVAAWAGADAIKIQTWTPDTMCIDPAYIVKSGPWAGKNLMQLYREAFTPWGWHKQIFNYARHKGLIAFSSPFDKQSVDFLETLNCPIYKIASFELIDHELIRYAALTGRPIVLSTGMASADEIMHAIHICKGNKTVVCKCTSEYPADASDANLETLIAFDGIAAIGLSDHSMGIGVAVAAATMGVYYIEKHLTLSRNDGGLDASFSMEPKEFKQMVEECRRAVAAIGTVKFGGDTTLRRSLYFAKDLPAGHPITANDCVTARPAEGMPPSDLPKIIGRILQQNVLRGTPVQEKYFG